MTIDAASKQLVCQQTHIKTSPFKRSQNESRLCLVLGKSEVVPVMKHYAMMTAVKVEHYELTSSINVDAGFIRLWQYELFCVAQNVGHSLKNIK
jgi:hypothetical protein